MMINHNMRIPLLSIASKKGENIDMKPNETEKSATKAQKIEENIVVIVREVDNNAKNMDKV